MAKSESGRKVSHPARHYRQIGSEIRPAKETYNGLPRKCCRFCIKIAAGVILHSWCCNDKPHGHNIRTLEMDKGPTKLSAADFIDNIDGYGKAHPAHTKKLADDLAKKLTLAATV